MTAHSHPFQQLTPDFVMDAVESQGFHCDCRNLTLNSYENRVYQVGIEDSTPLIAKFYRPNRWTEQQIIEEHELSLELAGHELPVVAPWCNPAGQSLFQHNGFHFALYPRQGGHAPEFDNLDNLLILGRMLGRMHRIGAVQSFVERPTLDSQSFGHASVALISEQFIPSEYRESYRILTSQLLERIEQALADAGQVRFIRTHGDCHSGNILWRDNAPHFVDFDDSRMAPAVQDLWMMLSGDRSRKLVQLDALLEGYQEFNHFDPAELRLIEPLRTLRMLHYSAWLASRWDDPAFPIAFPWFNSMHYWGEHILELREQLAALDELALELL
ncbi:Ser/Thr protein kinase RdoA involved in Cpx stress response, MazF antagonist [Trichlorobacter thiogenes]|uniref:Stress response kinase A n=1 Tax=Trichlorobacter thiogenes TaxID=115783 RepID=A0A1T4P0L4_9BACT|nr:serine/threonine protein kinase [Trichlorobacter thiogenes]SJZ84922.1 Ser/Thr protein kinase RdoA involved in Cpx stress response, MazF antagonist [Trichlorobacter thiogenes]